MVSIVSKLMWVENRLFLIRLPPLLSSPPPYSTPNRYIRSNVITLSLILRRDDFIVTTKANICKQRDVRFIAYQGLKQGNVKLNRTHSRINPIGSLLISPHVFISRFYVQ